MSDRHGKHIHAVQRVRREKKATVRWRERESEGLKVRERPSYKGNV